MIYLLIFLWLLYIVYKFEVKNGERNRRFYFYIAFIVLVCLAGFRFYIGTDTYHYRQDYDKYPDLFKFTFSDFNKYRYQPLWMLFVMFVQCISKEFVLLQFIVATILNIGVFKIISKYSKYPFLSIFIYYCTQYLTLNFELMRESVAVGVFLIFGFNNLIKGNWVKYFLCSVVCYQIHVSSIILFVLPFVGSLQFKTKHAIPSMVVLAIVTIVFSSTLSKFSLIFFSGNSSLEHYANSVSKIEGRKELNYYVNYYYIHFILLASVIYIDHKLKYKSVYGSYLMLSIFFGICSDISHGFLRFNNYLILFIILFFTDFVVLISKEFKVGMLKFAILSVFTYSAMFFYVAALGRPWVLGSKAKSYERWYPYRSIFEDLTKSQKEMKDYYRITYYDQMNK